MNATQALLFIASHAPCPHDDVDRSLGNGKIWCRCQECGETLAVNSLDKLRAAAKTFDEAVEVLQTYLGDPANKQAPAPAPAPVAAPTPPARSLSGFEKPLSEWTFQEVVSVTTWDVITGITQGHALKGLIHQALNFALIWKAEQDGKQK